jgi:hypothetical protein
MQREQMVLEGRGEAPRPCGWSFDERKMKNMRMLIIVFLSAITSSCAGSPAPESVEDFQTYYTSTKWYFSRYQAPLTDLPGFAIQDNRGMQAFLTSPSGTQIIYGELEPSDFMKAFRGNGTITKIPGIPEPIFEMESDYTQRNPTKILLIAFIGGRAIQIEATHANTNRTEVLREALAVAKTSYQQLLAKQSEDGKTSNKRLEATGDPLRGSPAPQP